MIGDDIPQPRAGGDFWGDPAGRGLQGSDGFRPAFQDDSVQIIHVVADIYIYG